MIVRRILAKDLIQELKSVGSDAASFQYFLSKSETIILKIYDINSKGANILKQEFLSAGGDVAVHRDVANFSKDTTDCILIGTPKVYKTVLEKLSLEGYFGLKKVRETLINFLEEKELPKLIVRRREFDFNSDSYVMGILNVTPDSFSDGGRFIDANLAVQHAKEMIEEGADIIDIGGESTRPGASEVDEDTEKRRVIPVIEGIRKFSEIPISIDTYKSSVAREALKAGADIINDISGLRFDPGMVKVAVEFEAPVVVMHIKGTPKDMQKSPYYEDLLKELLEYFEERIFTLTREGIKDIIIDPGIGFGKRYEDNLKIIKNLLEFKVFNRPVLIGTSRKSFIGLSLGDRPSEDRLYGTLAANTVALMNGASIIRVHDVKPHKDLIRVIKAIRNG